ncbi:MAG: PIG-L family deacetylase [Acidobacteria bacterium]|jgi:LmbE family N-acetylglucosaminyl deacetylase|nr:PIG-L family deacetylase [Acidobacteriota bacterium]
MSLENKRILAVGAHPDDVEIMCSGMLFLLKKIGYEIHVISLTAVACGSTEHPAEEISRLRQQEAQNACEVLGATYHFGGFKDLCIFNDDISNRRVTALLREIDPCLVITHSPQDYMSDHETTSLLVRNACFYAPIPNYETSSFTTATHTSAIPNLFYASPMEGVDIFGQKIAPQFYVDVSDCMKSKIQMLACHKSQRNWLRSHNGIDEYIENMIRWNEDLGQRASQLSDRSIICAESFRQHLGHAYPKKNLLSDLLPEQVVIEPN